METIWAGPAARSSRVDAAKPPSRALEVVTVILLAIATLGSAWCAFQVSQWNGVETDEARASAAARIEASREFALATQTIAYDAAMVAQYASAFVDENDDLQRFLRNRLIRTEFLPILEQWEAEAGTGVTTGLLETEDYVDGLLAPSLAADAEAAASVLRSEEAGSVADDYVLLTLFMASALFFAGITASFTNRLAKLMLLGAAVITLGFGAIQILDYPVA